MNRKLEFKNATRGSLPQYVVNLDNFGEILLGIMNSNKILDYGKQKIDGLHIKLSGKDIEEFEWKPTEQFTVITGFEFALNDCRNIGYQNSLDMFIDNEKYIDNFYFKEVDSQSKNLSVRKIFRNDKNKMLFVFKNKSKLATDLFVHIHYIGSMNVKIINVIAQNVANKETITQYQHYLIPPTVETICPLEIEEYKSLSECVTIDTETFKEDKVIFEYEKIEQEIEHNYDWLIKMYWEVSADFDLKCSIENEGTVSYSNKHIKLDDNNQCWLDYDYLTPQGKPEVITILGFKDRKAIVSVNLFRQHKPFNDQTIKIQVLKKDNKNTIIAEKDISVTKFKEGEDLPIFEINMATNKVRDLI